MSLRKDHILITSLLMKLLKKGNAKNYNWVHSWIDYYPYIKKYKWHHREVGLRHHPIVAPIIIYAKSKDPMASLVGLLHIGQDMLSTELKKALKRVARRKYSKK